MKHISVLLKEILENLTLKSGDVFFDGTVGLGGHTREVLKHFPNIVAIGTDRDPQALKIAEETVQREGFKVQLFNKNFKDVEEVLREAGLQSVNAVLLDLGVSSLQLDAPERGFSFREDAPLNMAFEGKNATITARDIVNNWEEELIANVLYSFADETFSRQIAKAIVTAREAKLIETTGELVAIIGASLPPWAKRGKTHFATKTFQALRMAVNDELGSLEAGLKNAFKVLAPEGRLLVISFHSIEDRLVKQFFQKLVKENQATFITKKPLTGTREEILINPRARSAKLRIIQKNAEHPRS